MSQFLFCDRKMFLMIGSKEFVSYFYNHNKNLYGKFEFLENQCICHFQNCVGTVLELLDIQQIFFEFDTSFIPVLRVSYECHSITVYEHTI